MRDRYGLPESVVTRVRERDRRCVYCHKEMVPPSLTSPRRDWATIEHLNHLPPWDNPETIAICCGSCNSSRGKKPLLTWLESAYCRERSISQTTVAEPVRRYLEEFDRRELSRRWRT